MKKMITATLLGGAIVAGPLLLGTGTANATTAMYKVGVDIQPGDYTYQADSYGGGYYLCKTTRCQPGDDLIDIDAVSARGTGYLTITSDVKYVKLVNVTLTPA
jgi:hypothetical protein